MLSKARLVRYVSEGKEAYQVYYIYALVINPDNTIVGYGKNIKGEKVRRVFNNPVKIDYMDDGTWKCLLRLDK